MFLYVHLRIRSSLAATTHSSLHPLVQGQRMSSVGSQESMDNLDFSYLLDGLVEAPTLSSKEMEHARKQALEILKTNSPEEAFKIFSQGSEVKAADDLAREKPHTPTMPPNGADAKAANGKVQPPPPKNKN